MVVNHLLWKSIFLLYSYWIKSGSYAQQKIFRPVAFDHFTWPPRQIFHFFCEISDFIYKFYFFLLWNLYFIFITFLGRSPPRSSPIYVGRSNWSLQETRSLHPTIRQMPLPIRPIGSIVEAISAQSDASLMLLLWFFTKCFKCFLYLLTLGKHSCLYLFQPRSECWCGSLFAIVLKLRPLWVDSYFWKCWDSPFFYYWSFLTLKR